MGPNSKILDFIRSRENFESPLFHSLAHATFQRQFESIAPYHSFIERQGIRPKDIHHVWEIPSWGTHAFKRFRLATFPDAETKATFFTSGTTQDSPGTHVYSTLDYYDLSCLTSFEDFFPHQKHFLFLALTPSRIETPHSSLAYMVDLFARTYGTYGVHLAFHHGQVETSTAIHAFQEAEQSQHPIFIATTAVALHDLLENLRNLRKKFALPPGSIVFETGGRKGRRAVPSSYQLAILSEEVLNLPRPFFFGEYGMTELSTPMWGTLESQSMVFQPTRWCPVRVVDPSTLNEVNVGEEGMIQLFDLANQDSISALLTGDWGRRQRRGFEILGRVIDAEVRGCSLLVSPRTETLDLASPILDFANIKRELAATNSVSLNLRFKTLAHLSDLWLNPHFETRKSFVEHVSQSGTFSKASVEEGLDYTFAALQATPLHEAMDRAGLADRTFQTNELFVQIPAGNLPITGVFGFYLGLLLGGISLHRPSHRGGHLLQELLNTLRTLSPELAERVRIVETPSSSLSTTQNLFSDASMALIQGDDETTTLLASLAPRTCQLLTQPSKFSVAFVPFDFTNSIEWMKLARDQFIWEQLGCMSPQAIFADRSLQFDYFNHACALAEKWKRKTSNRAQGATRWFQLDDLKWITRGDLNILEVDQLSPAFFGTPGVIQWLTLKTFDEVISKLQPFSEQIHSIALPHALLDSGLPQKLRERISCERIVAFGELQAPQFAPLLLSATA